VPQDIGHIPGSSNLLGDFPSRSFDEHLGNAEGDASFALKFSLRHPLPLQLGHWEHAQLTNALTSLILFDATGPDHHKHLHDNQHWQH
jgi:hypothetical protein